MAMNEINLVLQKFPSINREDLLILASILLDCWDNKCPKSLTSLRTDVDKWCSITIPIPDYYLIHHKTKPDCFGQSGFELIYVASFSSDYERIGFLHSDSRSSRRQFLP